MKVGAKSDYNILHIQLLQKWLVSNHHSVPQAGSMPAQTSPSYSLVK